MKKFIIFFSIILFTSTIACFAGKSWKNVQHEYYTSLLTCTPGKFVFKGYMPFAEGIVDQKVMVNASFEIYGAKNGLCKFKEKDSDEYTECEVPLHLAKAYGERMLAVLKMTEPPENDNISMILSWVLEGKYCKAHYKYE